MQPCLIPLSSLQLPGLSKKPRFVRAKWGTKIGIIRLFRTTATFLSLLILAPFLTLSWAQESSVGRLMLLAFDEALIPTAELLASYQPSGFLFYSDDIASTESLRAQIASLQSQASYPLIFAIDQEGGPFNSYRSDKATRFPGNMMLAATGKPELAKQLGLAMGQELAYAGLTMNFAPVVDVNTNPDNPIIGIRSFGDNPDTVSRYALAYSQGLEAAGIAAVAKHFPGHGNSIVDSHLDLPHIDSSLEYLREVDLKPFKTLLALPAIMSAHIVFEALDPHYPATLSPLVLSDLLRHDLGYQGVIISDYLDMQALMKSYSPGEAAVKAIEAGVDIVLVSSDAAQQQEIYQALEQAVATGRISQERLKASLDRITRLASTYPSQVATAAMPDYAKHQALAFEIARQGSTLIHNDGILPLRPHHRLTVITPEITGFGKEANLAEVLKHHGLANTSVIVPSNPDTIAINLALEQAQEADIILLGIYYWLGTFPTGMQHLYAELTRLDKPIIVISLANPDIEKYLKEPPSANLASYGFRESNLAALADILTGKANALGQLPIKLSQP